MPNHAHIVLVGHLGRDPETRYTAGGDAVTSFSIATNARQGKDKDDLTTWWNCTAWGKRGEAIAKYVSKGDPLLVRGEPCLRPWTGKDGSERQSLEVRVEDFTFLRGKDEAQGAQEPRRAPAARSAGGQAKPAQQTPREPAFDDEIPF